MRNIRTSLKPLALGFLAVAVIILIFSSFPSLAAEAARKAILSEVRGAVEVKISPGTWEPARTGMVLHELDEIRTGPASFTEVLLDDSGKTGRFEVEEKTRVRLNTMTWNSGTDEKQTLLDVAIGTIKIYVEKLKGKSKFEVNTPTAVLGVRGTVFKVTVDEKKTESGNTTPA